MEKCVGGNAAGHICSGGILEVKYTEGALRLSVYRNSSGNIYYRGTICTIIYEGLCSDSECPKISPERVVPDTQFHSEILT
jgi:hypothetical protein